MMESRRQVDALVSRTIFQTAVTWREGVPYTGESDIEIPHYSTDQTAATFVVQALKEKGYTIRQAQSHALGGSSYREYEAVHLESNTTVAVAAGPDPLAICMVALRALGEQV